MLTGLLRYKEAKYSYRNKNIKQEFFQKDEYLPSILDNMMGSHLELFKGTKSLYTYPVLFTPTSVQSIGIDVVVVSRFIIPAGEKLNDICERLGEDFGIKFSTQVQEYSYLHPELNDRVNSLYRKLERIK